MVEQRSFDKLVGAEVGNYRLRQMLGQSKYGPIFVVRSAGSDTPYLMRLLALPEEMTAEARLVYLGLFQQEANRVAALRHPHILPLLDYGNYRGMPYLVLPHVSPLTLRAQLAQYGPPPALTVARYIDQAAAALEYAHQRGVLHRNLTTDSILFDRRAPVERQNGGPQEAKSDSILIADFGILRMLELSRQDRQDGQVYRLYGSSESIAPEQVQGQTVGTFTDVYALGTVAYRLLTGHPVFSGSTREAIFQQHVQAPMPPLDATAANALDSDARNRLNALLARALAKNPALRYQHPEEFAAVFHSLIIPNDKPGASFAIGALLAQNGQTARNAQFAQGVQSFGPVAPLSVPMVPRPVARRTPLERRISRRTVIWLASGTVVAAAAAVIGSHYLSSPGSGGTPVATSASTPASAATKSGGQAGSTPAATHSGTVIAQTSAVPVNSAKTFPIPNSSNPGVLVHLADNRFVAFNSTCTHQGCAVSYNAQAKLLECPCHQAAFDPTRNAAVVQGPAPTPLTTIPITVNADGTITAKL